MASSTVTEELSVRGAGSSDSGEFPEGFGFRCPCCNAEMILRDIDLRVVRGPSRRVLNLEVDRASGLEETVREVRRQLVRLALDQSRGVKARAAELLGLKYSTFWEMVERLGCDQAEKVDDPEESAPMTDVPLEDVEEIVVLCRRTEGPPVEVKVIRRGSLLRCATRQVKLSLTRRALDRAGGNVARAAEIAGMKYTTFYSFLNRLPAGALDEVGGGS